MGQPFRVQINGDNEAMILSEPTPLFEAVGPHDRHQTMAGNVKGILALHCLRDPSLNPGHHLVIHDSNTNTTTSTRHVDNSADFSIQHLTFAPDGSTLIVMLGIDDEQSSDDFESVAMSLSDCKQISDNVIEKANKVTPAVTILQASMWSHS